MNGTDFVCWQAFHAARFPLWASWLRNLPKDAGDGLVTQSDVLAAMADTLGDVSLADAKEASRLLSCGEEPEIDKYDDHPRRVRAVARRLSSERIKRMVSTPPKNLKEPTYRCLDCMDEGRVSVWHPQTVQDAKHNAEALVNGQLTTFTCVVACNCEAGRRFADNGYRRLSVFMEIVPDGLDRKARLLKLVEFVNSAKRHEWNPDDCMVGDFD